jgi:hypothetical protein
MKEEYLLSTLEMINETIGHILKKIDKLEAHVFNHEEPKEPIRHACKPKEKLPVIRECLFCNGKGIFREIL